MNIFDRILKAAEDKRDTASLLIDEIMRMMANLDAEYGDNCRPEDIKAGLCKTGDAPDNMYVMQLIESLLR